LTLTVRPARPGDVAAVVEIARRAWTEGFEGVVPPDVMPDAEEMANVIGRIVAHAGDPVVVAVAELDRKACGYVTFGPARDPEAGPATGEVYALYVDPSNWRCGAGRGLVSHALASLTESGFAEAIVWTLAETPRSRRFYEAVGFVDDGATQRRPMTGGALEVRYRTRLG
jgi:L-amino acid N-acyltransferase YncA